MSARAIVREVTALIDEAERGVRELYPRLYEQMESEGGATCLTTRRLREAIARGEAAGGDVPLDGATEPGPENAWPANPGEFAARWNALDVEARARWLGEAVEAMSSIDATTWRAEAAEAEIARMREVLAKVRVAVELVVQDVRAQRGDHIAGLVEDSFAAHMALASVPAVDGGDRATGAIVPERDRCTCPDGMCVETCRACNHSGRDLEEPCIKDPEWEPDDADLARREAMVRRVDAGDREPASEGGA